MTGRLGHCWSGFFSILFLCFFFSTILFSILLRLYFLQCFKSLPFLLYFHLVFFFQNNDFIVVFIVLKTIKWTKNEFVVNLYSKIKIYLPVKTPRRWSIFRKFIQSIETIVIIQRNAYSSLNATFVGDAPIFVHTLILYTLQPVSALYEISTVMGENCAKQIKIHKVSSILK